MRALSDMLRLNSGPHVLCLISGQHVSEHSPGFFLQDLPPALKRQTVVNKGAVNKFGVKSSGGPEFSRPEFRDSSVRKWNGPIVNDVYVNDVYVNGPYINDFSSAIYNFAIMNGDPFKNLIK